MEPGTTSPSRAAARCVGSDTRGEAGGGKRAFTGPQGGWIQTRCHFHGASKAAWRGLPSSTHRALTRQPGQFPNIPPPLSPKPASADPGHRQTLVFAQTLNISQREYSGTGMFPTHGRQALGAGQMALPPSGLVTFPEGRWSCWHKEPVRLHANGTRGSRYSHSSLRIHKEEMG